jgi:hypothetical protein
MYDKVSQVLILPGALDMARAIVFRGHCVCNTFLTKAKCSLFCAGARYTDATQSVVRMNEDGKKAEAENLA